MRKKLIFLMWLIVSVLLWFAYNKYNSGYLQKLFLTFLILAIIYFVFRFVFEEVVIKRIKDSKTKYSFRKTVSILYIFVFVLILLRIWVAGDQATGRLTILPNGLILSGTINNYTKDHNFIWDEISIPITYQSDWKGANKMIQEIVARETRSVTEQAGKEILTLEEKYYLSKRSRDLIISISHQPQ